ncbi:MAG: sensor histidine kinase [Myxococcota bacterium]
MDALARLFGSDGFMPHGHCYLWDPRLLWLHVVSDGLIALAYTTIPVTLAWFVRQRRDLPFSWIFVCFATFIVSCGLTHYMSIWTVWEPSYWLAGGVKALTAAASVPTALLLARLVPVALAVPTPAQYEDARARTEESRAAYRALLETSQDALVVLVPAETDGNLAYGDLNSAAERLLGATRGEVLGRDVAAAPRSRLLVALEAELREVVRTGEPMDREVIVAEKDGERVFHVQASPVQSGVGVLARDVTDRVRAAADLRASEERYRELAASLDARVRARTAELEAVNAELEAFAYSVSHDLRGPIRAIDGFSHALSEDAGDRLPSVAHDHLARIRRATARMSELIDGLLTLSRVTRGEIRSETVDVAETARSVVAILREEAPEREVAVHVDARIEVRGDPALLRVAVENLLSNAWKYTSQREDARVEVAATEDGFVMRDNGAGFDMAWSSKLFRPFERLHGTDEFPGTGIGLAIVERIVRRHGGSVHAERRVGEGAAFFVRLPR